MSEGEGTMVDKSESSSFEDLASAAAQEIEEAKLAEAAASAQKSPDENKDEWQDVLGSKALFKKILKSGDESEGRPQRGNICTISYKLTFKDDTSIVIEDRDHIDIYLGDNEVIQGIDLALTLMERGERCLLQLSPRFAYGEAGLRAGDGLGQVGAPAAVHAGPAVAADTWLQADLQLHSWREEPELEELSIQERIELGVRRRQRGNWWYTRDGATLAVQLYRRALDVLDESGGITEPTASGDVPPPTEPVRAMLEERLRAHNNMAAAQLKAGAYDAALQAVSHVLTCQPDNSKALYRKARVLSALGRDAEALEAARRAAALAPQDAGVRSELQRCADKARRDRSVERRLAERMLGAAAARAPRDPRAAPAAPGKKPSRTKVLVWGSLLLSLLVGVCSVLVYRYRMHAH